ncbi:MAG TPA: hypothetical protein VEY92_13630 [Pseudoxanthomonas sp.]|nr:hypothetical protein [Pseudoxanthomonas sp.]
MNTAPVYDPRLKPRRRLLQQLISVRSAGEFNVRVECLVIRAGLVRLLEHAEHLELVERQQSFERRHPLHHDHNATVMHGDAVPIVGGLVVEEIETVEVPAVVESCSSAKGLEVVELDVGSIELSLAQANGWGSAGQYPARHSAKTPTVQERVLRVAAGSGLASARATAHAAVGGGVV